jgi:succinyl-diaminopimelate desuccinylase
VTSSPTFLLTKALLERPSVTPDDQGCQAILSEFLEPLGFEISHYPIHQTKNLWARRGNKKPLLCFSGHTDVVPPGDHTAWVSPPFVPTIRNGKLYARGAADMKSSIAAMATACQRFIDKHPQHAGSIAFLITSDEEGHGLDGTRAVLKMLAEKQEIPEWCLVGEASSGEKLADIIKVGRRGSITGYLKINGKQGHVAYPHLADNPIHRAFKALQALVDLSWDQGEPPFPPTTFQFANVHSGTGATNVIPGVLEANFNLRYSPASPAEIIQEKIKAILDESGCEYSLDWYLGGKLFYTSPDSFFLKKISQVIEEHLGYASIHSTDGGTSDGRFFAEYGSDVVEVGPKNESIHQVNENIDLEELENLSTLYEKILVGLLV